MTITITALTAKERTESMMYIAEQTYAETNRALKRKVRKAKKDGADTMTLPTGFLDTVSSCLDDLWFHYKHEKKGE